MSGKMRRMAVFCGSNPGRRPEYLEAAREMGRALVERDLSLVYGGGKASRKCSRKLPNTKTNACAMHW